MITQALIFTQNLNLANTLRALIRSYDLVPMIRNNATEALGIAEKGEALMIVDADILEAEPTLLGSLQTRVGFLSIPIIVVYNPESQILTRQELESRLPTQTRIINLPVDDKELTAAVESLLLE